MKFLDLSVRMSTADKTQMRAAFGLELKGAGQAQQTDSWVSNQPFHIWIQC